MVVKTFDRYVISTFLKNYLISFMVLVGLYIVLDTVFHFDDMFSVSEIPGGGGIASAFAVLRNIGDYYFYQIFLFFVHLSGIIPVVAAAFTLIRLSRFNELTAMLAAGVPLLRITLPIMIVGLILNGLLMLDEQVLIPRIAHKLVREHGDVHQARASSYPIRAMQDANRSLLIGARYTPPVPKSPATIDQIDVIERDASLQPTAHLWAERAVWDRRAQVWRLSNGRRTTGLLPGERSVTRNVAELRTSITPEEIALYKSSDTVEFLASSRINQLLERPESYGKIDLLRVKHWRFVQPFSNFLLLLLAIPCVLTREAGSLKMAAMKCVMLTGGCLTVLFLCHQVAGVPPVGSPEWLDRWPAIMAWMPLFIFLPVAVWLLDRVKT
jgi:lipopolysaccharide export system permease protein